MQIKEFTFSLTKKQAEHVAKLLTRASDESVYEKDLVIIEVTPLDVRVCIVNQHGEKVEICG